MKDKVYHCTALRLPWSSAPFPAGMDQAEPCSFAYVEREAALRSA